MQTVAMIQLISLNFHLFLTIWKKMSENIKMKNIKT